MKKILLVIFITSTIVYANDGGIAIAGGALHPVNITNITMEYERLNITCKENYFEIEAYIELYNHDSASVQPLLGFEFYEGMLSHYDSYRLDENINRFVLHVNNVRQKFEYRIRDEMHTLVFQPVLNPGNNTVFHKFHLPYGFGSANGIVSYILKTSSRWKDGIIRDIEIYIRTERNIMLCFEEWNMSTRRYVRTFQTMGESKLFRNITTPPSGSGIFHYEYYSLTPNGYLYKNIKNFIPDRDIKFQTTEFTGMPQYQDGRYDDPPYRWPNANPFILLYDWKKYIENNEYRRYFAGGGYFFVPSDEMLESLNSEQLRILRNSLYAIYGYVFNDIFLQEYFNRQYWYFPNPNINMSNIIFDDAEKRILEYIFVEERKR
ncbi:MAG: YARHG domain-containing protein [Treponema sp.]|jgi:hypothetical protein|nr:YARHG domain-containing protein [Treponema sp.]